MARTIQIGIAGLGAAGRAFLPAIRDHATFHLTAICDPVAEILENLAAETGAKAFADLPSMLSQADLDAVYIATPTELHADHAALAFAAGKHVLTEKPMAIRIDQAQAMIAAADRAGAVLLVGHAHGYDRPIQAMRDIIASGRLGSVRMIHTLNYTDWMYRPRRPDEFDLSLGGGVTFRQGSHQFDIIRLLGGGLLRSVRATTFDWDANRRSTGAHVVYLTFEDGAAATAIYNGYGYFSAMELVADVTEWGFTEPIDKRPPVQRKPSGADELTAKRRRAANAIPAAAPYQPHFGFTLVSCERGDIRQSPSGLYIYSDKGREEIVLPNDKSPRHLVLDEFADAILGRKKPVHDGRWGLANLETCLAAIESSQCGMEIALKYQVAAER